MTYYQEDCCKNRIKEKTSHVFTNNIHKISFKSKSLTHNDQTGNRHTNQIAKRQMFAYKLLDFQRRMQNIDSETCNWGQKMLLVSFYGVETLF